MRLLEAIDDRLRTSHDRDVNERGAALLIVTFSLLVLLGMAAFSVDLGWLYYNDLEARKAAEAAALAGVVHMPLPSGTSFGPGTQPYDVAVDVASRNGFGSATPTETAFSNQLKVDTARTVDTFFMRVFGINQVTVHADATAEQLPPLKIGSDGPQLGGGSQELWVAINGDRRKKNSGDPFSTHCVRENNNCGGTQNAEYRDPAYYYAVEVLPAGAGSALGIDIWDGPHFNRPNIDTETGEYSGEDGWFLTFDVYAPDQTPNDWSDNSDNSSAVCSRTFSYTDDSSPGSGVNEWAAIGGCPFAQAGIYVIEVSTGGSIANVSAFAIRASAGGPANVAVYGLGSMSLWMNQDNSNPVFQLVRLDTVYAGTELVLRLFDPGDATGLSRLRFDGALAGTDCMVRVTNEFGTTGPLQSDGALNPDGDWAGSSCGITTATNSVSRIFNGDWVEMRFDIDAAHACSGSACWVYVNYNFTNSPFDRTTWSATINGSPIHLEP